MIPDQHPETPPRYRFRPRSDRYRLPTFRAPMTPRVPDQPYERYETNEPRDFGWDELKDPSVWFGGGVMFAAFVILLIVVLSSGPTPV